MAYRLESVSSQQASLARMARLVADGLTNPKTGQQLIEIARTITADCEARDDQCEAEAIFNAIKYGTDKIPGLKRGVRYVADPRGFDYFSSAAKTLNACAKGTCAGDCDDHSILSATLLAGIGFKAGLRAWGPKIGKREYTHVYAVVALPKNGPWPQGYSGHGFDTTVADSYVGWEPRKGEVYTIWLEEDD